MPRPTLIFAPGAWYPSTAFDPIFPKLSDYKCRSIAFPSITKATEIKDLEPDTQAVRSTVQEEVDAGQDVIVIAHSWAGLPVNSALDGLSKLEREAEGLKGGVVKLVFIAAFLPQIGEGLIGAFGGTPPPWYVVDEQTNTFTTSDPQFLFFHDVPDGAEWAKLLLPHACATKTAPATSTAYMNIPTSFLLCEEDRAIPVAVQQVLVDRARKCGAEIETEKIQTGHTPWLVVPDQVVAYLKKQAGESE
ncbi:hypothetical protein PENANT_c028G08897 [Penicillium antarcticum]|uniref:AB hydrolase-1 domain-containing protein n=1 Tax=Penicillium antarcticum TaxID=416450 RepID=A0A1V6PW96_9EURO|nr:uncharacterized protein N7508_009039 [Penicillium antarcticum]KAJ5294218.1 hypothetical protein N7508_009039 [Penicillium antarcticum]OQD81299.1 hypothetical protein PENANT_c028G08897 [Penicillium antarcticum]